jgi:GAF domain-containing protein
MNTIQPKIIPLSRLPESVRQIIKDGGEKEELLQRVAQFLHESVSFFDWVGFYLVDETKERTLKLGPYVGDETDHVSIGFGEGICGQAAETLETFVVQDVSKESNYLSCSPSVKSEIVVPIMKGDVFVGELDIDSHLLQPFSETHRLILEEICNDLSDLF